MNFEVVRFAKRFFKETFSTMRETAFASFESLAVAKVRKYLCKDCLFKVHPLGHYKISDRASLNFLDLTS